LTREASALNIFGHGRRYWNMVVHGPVILHEMAPGSVTFNLWKIAHSLEGPVP